MNDPLQLVVNAEGMRLSDIDDAIRGVLRLVGGGFRIGNDRHETGRFAFTLTGNEAHAPSVASAAPDGAATLRTGHGAAAVDESASQGLTCCVSQPDTHLFREIFDEDWKFTCSVQARHQVGIAAALERILQRVREKCSSGAGSSRDTRWTFALTGKPQPTAGSATPEPHSGRGPNGEACAAPRRGR